MQKIFLLAGSLSGALSVMIGAFGAHALKAKLSAINKLDVYETAVKYQFYHSLAMLLLGVLLFHIHHTKAFTWSGYCFLAGILIFSGSLYILCLTNTSWWGAITPIGGLFLIAGWILLFLGIANGL